MKHIAVVPLQSQKPARNEWGWLFALGIGLFALGICTLWAIASATLPVMAIGAILILAGVVELVAAFKVGSPGAVISLFFMAALDALMGIVLLAHPAVATLDLTILLAVLFGVGGLYRFVAASSMQLPHTSFVALSGLVSIALCLLVWMQWSFSATWFVGLAIGVNLIVAGIAWSSLGIQVKND